MDNANPTCHICGKGAPEGLRLAAGYICPHCLREICRTQVGDKMYPFYVAKLRELWQAG